MTKSEPVPMIGSRIPAVRDPSPGGPRTGKQNTLLPTDKEKWVTGCKVWECMYCGPRRLVGDATFMSAGPYGIRASAGLKRSRRKPRDVQGDIAESLSIVARTRTFISECWRDTTQRVTSLSSSVKTTRARFKRNVFCLFQNFSIYFCY